MREKINELRDQEQEITDEIRVNEDLGKKVLNMVESKATQSEFSKFELFIGELNKIVALLLSLTQRLHRYELMLQDLDMSNEADKIKKVCVFLVRLYLFGSVTSTLSNRSNMSRSI